MIALRDPNASARDRTGRRRYVFTPTDPMPPIAHNPQKAWESRIVKPGEECEAIDQLGNPLDAYDPGRPSARVRLIADGYRVVLLVRDLKEV